MYLVEIYISQQSLTSTELSLPIPISYTFAAEKHLAGQLRRLKPTLKRGGGIIVKIKMIVITINICPRALLPSEFISVLPQIKTGVDYKSSKNVNYFSTKRSN
jgi:hypothetical protein